MWQSPHPQDMERLNFNDSNQSSFVKTQKCLPSKTFIANSQ